MRTAWLDAYAEWGPGVHEDGFGIRPSDEVHSPTGFATWVKRLTDESVSCSYRWILEGDQVLGGIALRHQFNDFVRRVGHIGYGIRPSARQRGLATWALGRMLEEARMLGMEWVLVVCEAGNVGSMKTIERNGGVLEDASANEHPGEWRYWIPIGDPTV